NLGQRARRRRLAGPQHEPLAVVLEQQVVRLGVGVVQRVADGHRGVQGVSTTTGLPSGDILGAGASPRRSPPATGASGCGCPGTPIGASTGASLIGSTTLGCGCAPCC